MSSASDNPGLREMLQAMDEATAEAVKFAVAVQGAKEDRSYRSMKAGWDQPITEGSPYTLLCPRWIRRGIPRNCARSLPGGKWAAHRAC